MLTLTIFIVMGILLGIAELLDWFGRFDLIEQKWPRVYKAMTSKISRIVLYLFMIVLIVEDIEKRSEIPEAPHLRFNCPKAPDFTIVKVVAPEPKERPDSLRRRTIALVNEISVFWSRRPTLQNTGPEEERQRASNQWWRDAMADYTSAHYKERILGIIREYKNMGVETGQLERSVDQPDRLVGAAPYGGSSLNNCINNSSELCVLQELAYHVTANDKPIFLTVKRKK